MGRIRKVIDWKAFEEALNRNGRISKTCLEFGISDVGLKQYLNVRGLKLLKTYSLKAIDENLETGLGKNEMDYDDLVERLNGHESKAEIARSIGMEWNLLVLFLKRRNIEVNETFKIVKEDTVTV